MAKFVMECPKCGKYVEAKTGIFSRKKIDCSCGYTINVRTDSLTSRQCPSCGNTVVFDQKLGSKAVCPVCHEPINTTDIQSKSTEITCGQCGITLILSRSASKYTCPVCDFENDVQQRIVQERISKDSQPSIIKYEGDNDTFVWKHPIEDFRYGSQLIVHESQEAVFFRDGQALDSFERAGRYTLETQLLPVMGRSYPLPTDAHHTFHSEVYFINKTVQMAIKWGTPDKVRFIDPLTGTPLEIGASGEMNLQVDNSRKLLTKLVGTMNGISWEGGPGFTKSLQASFRPLITSAVKTNLPAVITSEAIDILEIDSKLDIISESLRQKILPGFEEYGLTIPQLYVTNVVLPDDDPNFKRIRDLHTVILQTREIQAEATVKTVQAQSEAQYKTAQAQSEAQYKAAEEQSKAIIEAAHREAELQRQMTETEIAKMAAERRIIEAQAVAESQKLVGLSQAEVMEAQGYTKKDVLEADVQKAYANGLGKMGPAVSMYGGPNMVNGMPRPGFGYAAVNPVRAQFDAMLTGTSQTNIPQSAGNVSHPVNTDSWNCSCGEKGITSKFCPQCGNKRPEQSDAWICPQCGTKGITSKFCPECGTKKPEAPLTWDCPSCGKKGLSTRFCPECGHKKED